MGWREDRQAQRQARLERLSNGATELSEFYDSSQLYAMYETSVDDQPSPAQPAPSDDATVQVFRPDTSRARASSGRGAVNPSVPRRGVTGASRGPRTNAVNRVEYEAVMASHYFKLDMYPQRYYLEMTWGPGEAPFASVELPLVNSISCTAPLSVKNTFTESGSLYEEHSNFLVKTFKLTGRSGFSADYLTRFHKLRNFISNYGTFSEQNKNALVRGRDFRLILNFPWEGESYFAQVVNFDYQRVYGSTTFSFAYVITLRTYGWATRKWSQPENVDAYLNCEGDNCHTGLAHPCRAAAFRETTTAPEDTRALFPLDDEIHDLADEAFDTPVSTTSTAGRDLQREIVRKCKRASDIAYEQWEALNDEQAADQWGSITTVVGWYENMSMSALRVLGLLSDVLGDQEPGEVNDPGRALPPSPTYKGRRVVDRQVEHQTTWLQLAQDFLLDGSLWVTLMHLNGADDPRLDKDGQLFRPGMIVKVPDNAGLAFTETLLGTDLKIVDGDLVSVGGTDYAWVSGLANYAQNVDHRLETERGRNRAFPNFGLRKLKGTLEADPATVMSDVKSQLMADRRTDRVTQMSVEEPSSDTLKLKFTVKPIGSNTVLDATSTVKV